MALDHYDRDGNPMSREAWAQKFEDFHYRSVCNTVFDETVRISTVWLGLDHGWGSGPPVIFETMIFGLDDNEWCERYSTENQAIEGHRRAIEYVLDRLNPNLTEDVQKAIDATRELLDQLQRSIEKSP